MAHFDVAIGKTMLVEGGGRFTDDPKDSGGATRWGITERVAREFGYQGPMAELPKEVAVAIYKARYWDKLKLSAVAFFSPRLAYEMFDSAVNIGPVVVGKWLQRTLNALNDGGAKYPDVEVDGEVGQTTLTAMRLYMEQRGADGEAVLHAALNGLQAAFYIELCESKPKNERFVFGWLLQRVVEKK
jgi:typhoid toxin secretion A